MANGGCTHQDFDAAVTVQRVEEHGVVIAFVAEVWVHCKDCGQPFEFKGMRAGLDFNGPTASFDGQEARLPIKPVHAKIHETSEN